MLKKTQIRKRVIEALLDNDSLVIDAHSGLTLAGEHVYDTPLELSGDSCGSLPAITIYVNDERYGVDDEQQWRDLCFPDSSCDLVLELYACASESHELEDVLDQFEEQVRTKLLPSAPFYKLAKLRGYTARTVRSKESRRLGLRQVTMTLNYKEDAQPPPDDAAPMNPPTLKVASGAYPCLITSSHVE